MRTITTELLNRVKAKWQAPAENADPSMKAYLSRGFINELFQTFTIQEGSTLEEVDVTVSRPETESAPAEALALALDNGVATVLSKLLPYDDMVPWVTEYQVATGVSSVAIEFDGYWDRDFNTRRFNFVTEETPWLFYVISGVLYAQYGQNGTPTALASDVSKVAAIRGWIPANGDQANDQGLIVAYIKTDGTMFCKPYCVQADGEKAWEIEQQITEFVGTVSNLALFRTNDFRIGFMAEIAGETWWTFSERNYAGMSYWPDMLTGQYTGITAIELTRIEESDLTIQDETLAGDFGLTCISINSDSFTAGTCTKGEITGPSEITLEFSQKVTGNLPRLVRLLSVTNSDKSLAYTVNDVSLGDNPYKMKITVSELLDTENAALVTIGEYTIYLTTGNGEMLPVAPFEVSVSMFKQPYHFINLAGRFSTKTITLTEIYYSESSNQELANLTGKYVGATSAILTKVGGGDV
ncbi:MAG TPA: hypothetical protein DIT32_03440 [Peptococcaceae bacterium]|nr:hypothetical protein [Peptococcaceae bacterium]